MSPDEIHDMGLELIAQFHGEMDAILRAQGMTRGSVAARVQQLSRRPDQLYPNTDAGRAQILADLNAQTRAIEAMMPRAFNTLAQAQLEIRRVPVTTEAGAPNDEVNLGQSSNDVFPTAMHLAVLQQVPALRAALAELRAALEAKAQAFAGVVKIGRTHWQDATPVTLGQEFSGYVAQLALCEQALQREQTAVQALAIGSTAVGTGLNTHAEFGPRVAQALSGRLGLALRQADNLFAAMAGHEALVAWHGALKTLAVALTKIGNDIRLMGSGPRAGIGELQLPENEPGSSIMPGKVNPTQVEALSMVCAQVLGHDVAIGFAASQGQFELNVYKPLIVLNVLDSMRLLGDAMRSFARHCVAGLVVNEVRVAQLLNSSLMLVTALAPHIGYDAAARIAKTAHARGLTLREAALDSGLVSAEQFDAWVDARRMLGPDPGPGGG
jgi:fumarate hydratase class II